MNLVRYTNRTPFDAAVDRLLGFQSHCGTSAESGEAATRSPRTNVTENDNGYVFTMEMPGVTKKDVEVSIESDRLVIRGGSESENEEISKDLVRREFRSTRFERSFALGTDVDRDKIKAVVENGVLTLTVPKAAAYVGRRIEIT